MRKRASRGSGLLVLWLLFGLLVAFVPAGADDTSDDDRKQQFHDDRRDQKLSSCGRNCQSGLNLGTEPATLDPGPAPAIPNVDPVIEVAAEAACIALAVLNGATISEATAACSGDD